VRGCKARPSYPARIVETARVGAHRRTHFDPLGLERVSSLSLSGAGAVVTVAFRLLAAAVRALTAPVRATRRARMDPTTPVRSFGDPTAVPARAERAPPRHRSGRSCPAGDACDGQDGPPQRRRRLVRTGSGQVPRRDCRYPPLRPRTPHRGPAATSAVRGNHSCSLRTVPWQESCLQRRSLLHGGRVRMDASPVDRATDLGQGHAVSLPLGQPDRRRPGTHPHRDRCCRPYSLLTVLGAVGVETIVSHATDDDDAPDHEPHVGRPPR